MRLFKDKVGKEDKTLNSHHWILAVILFFLIGVLMWLGISDKNYLFLFVSAILLGIYYGFFNYRIFHYPHTDEFYREYLSTKKSRNEGYFDEVPAENNVAKINSIWVHIVCTIVGSLALHFFNLRFSSLSGQIKNEEIVLNSMLFLVALGGYTGLLPRWIWFFASKGGPGEIAK